MTDAYCTVVGVVSKELFAPCCETTIRPRDALATGEISSANPEKRKH